MRLSRKIVATGAAVACLAAPAARASGPASTELKTGCIAVAVVSHTCTYVATTRDAVLAMGRFDVQIRHGNHLTEVRDASPVPRLLSLRILPGDRVTLVAWPTGHVWCAPNPSSFVRAGPEVYSLGAGR